jgi:hypothetical protein
MKKPASSWQSYDQGPKQEKRARIAEADHVLPLCGTDNGRGAAQLE